jgi:purine-binding chemotaxis protein CheW
MEPDQETPGKEGKVTDWSEIHRRLASEQKALAGGIAPSPEERRAILRARARILALEPRKDAGPQDSLEIIQFRLAGETYGIASAFVREVYPLKDLTPLPGTPTFVLGIINLRGQILSVVDLKAFFNLPQKGLGDLNKVIILCNDRMEFGILADAILATHQVLLDAIQPMPLAVTGIGAKYLKGVTGEHSIILDAEMILGDKKIIVHQEVAEAESE